MRKTQKNKLTKTEMRQIAKDMLMETLAVAKNCKAVFLFGLLYIYNV